MSKRAAEKRVQRAEVNDRLRMAALEGERDAARAELAALQQEVIDVCLAAPQPQIVTCPYCKGARRVEGVHHTEYGPRCYYVDCPACAGRGVVIG